MREIKFRAWDGEKKRMVHFDELNCSWTGDFWSNDTGEENYRLSAERTDTENTKGYNHDDFNEEKDCILMQFIGLKDKNGKEIYKGDVVRRWYDSGRDDYGDVEVYLGNELGQVTIRKTYKKGKKTETVLFNEQWQSENCKIIGNVHENPELL